ncbi:HNH endonuclease [Metapseudomonas otitidis]|uniref:HNH endonuclease n=1 Tax=Metapseudomonas otitidis TaxID=319939 RepID=UPI0024492A0D|nr:HNH endonuclease signature motif containing protein [Pseudomonas otitidis]MDH0336161.1 HNH endonuclease [Pseudomonas otitidis]
MAASNSDYRHIASVKYGASVQTFVNSYNTKPQSEKNGKFWDGKEDALTETKKEIKNHYLAVQDYTCAYCKQRVVVEHNGAWDTDHIIDKDGYPQFLFEPENLCLSCKDCNTIKSKKQVLKNKRRVTFPNKPGDYIFCHPHFHKYSEHVRIIKDGALYFPITKEGQSLIEICGLLRFSLAFAKYDYADSDIASEVIRLATELQNAQTASQRLALKQIMKTMLDESLRADALRALGR